MPAQVRPAAEARIDLVEAISRLVVRIDAVQAATGAHLIGCAGRRAALIATETAGGEPPFSRVDPVIAGTEGDGQRLWNDVEVHGPEQRLLAVAANDVIEIRLVVGPD